MKNQDEVIAELNAVYAAAKEAGNWAPALRALEMLGRHFGMWSNTSSNTTDYADLVVADPFARRRKTPNETDE